MIDRNPSPNEENDLIVILDYLGDKINRIFGFFVGILKGLFDFVINLSRTALENFKMILAVLVIAIVAGIIVEKVKPPVYESSMIVRTYFDAQYQLHSNLQYYNTLLSEGNYDVLSTIFELNDEELKKIVEFELLTGPENENEKILKYDRYLKSIDSIRAVEITFEDYLENRDIFSNEVFEVKVRSKQKDIFEKLEAGLSKSFENAYSLKKRQKRDSMLYIRKQTILSSLAEIDSLQNVYINVLEEESQSTKASISLGEGFPLQQEKSDTKEYQLLNKEIELRNEMRALEEEQVQENEFFDVISSFPKVGERVTSLDKKYSVLFPLLALAFMFLGYLASLYVKFVKNYES